MEVGVSVMEGPPVALMEENDGSWPYGEETDGKWETLESKITCTNHKIHNHLILNLDESVSVLESMAFSMRKQNHHHCSTIISSNT